MNHALSQEQQQPIKTFFLASFAVFAFYFLVARRFDFTVAFAVSMGLFVLGWLGYELIRFPALGVALMVIGTSLDVVGRIGGLPLTVFHVGVLLTLAALAIRIQHSGRLTIETTSFNLPLALFLLMIGLSLLYTPDRVDGVYHFGRVVALV